MWKVHKMIGMRSLAALAALGTLWVGPAAAAVQSIPVDLSVPFAPTPVSAEGQRHLLYELHVTNVGSSSLTLERVEILDRRTHAVLAAYSGVALEGVLARPGMSASSNKSVIDGGLRAIVFVDVVEPEVSTSHATLFHRLFFKTVTLASAAREQTTVEGGAIRVNARSPILLAPPLRGTGWIASHALSNASSHRRTFIALNGRLQIAQRFAVDWIRIGSDGQAFRGNPAVNSNWSAYGAEVLAVAGGRVVDIEDGIPENDPTSDTKAIPITFDNATGNHVVLDLGGGRFALYAHLQPHTFRVRLGQSVRAGQVLALLGNSGKSDAPHLHFQIVDRNSPLASEGLPFALRSFDLLGHVGSLQVLADGTGWHATAVPSPRHNEMPLENAVVRFRH